MATELSRRDPRRSSEGSPALLLPARGSGSRIVERADL